MRKINRSVHFHGPGNGHVGDTEPSISPRCSRCLENVKTTENAVWRARIKKSSSRAAGHGCSSDPRGDPIERCYGRHAQLHRTGNGRRVQGTDCENEQASHRTEGKCKGKNNEPMWSATHPIAARRTLPGAHTKLQHQGIRIGELVPSAAPASRWEPQSAKSCCLQKGNEDGERRFQAGDDASWRLRRAVDDVMQASYVACEICLCARARAVSPESALFERGDTHTDVSAGWLDMTVVSLERGPRFWTGPSYLLEGPTGSRIG